VSVPEEEGGWVKSGVDLKTGGRWWWFVPLVGVVLLLLCWVGGAAGVWGFRAPLRTNLVSRSLSMLWCRMMRLMKKEAIAAPVMVQ
jgi:hypothetical protein